MTTCACGDGSQYIQIVWIVHPYLSYLNMCYKQVDNGRKHSRMQNLQEGVCHRNVRAIHRRHRVASTLPKECKFDIESWNTIRSTCSWLPKHSVHQCGGILLTQVKQATDWSCLYCLKLTLTIVRALSCVWQLLSTECVCCKWLDALAPCLSVAICSAWDLQRLHNLQMNCLVASRNHSSRSISSELLANTSGFVWLLI